MLLNVQFSNTNINMKYTPNTQASLMKTSTLAVGSLLDLTNFMESLAAYVDHQSWMLSFPYRNSKSRHLDSKSNPTLTLSRIT